MKRTAPTAMTLAHQDQAVGDLAHVALESIHVMMQPFIRRDLAGEELSLRTKPGGRKLWAQRHCCKTVDLMEKVVFSREHLEEYMVAANQPGQDLPITLWPNVIRLLELLVAQCSEDDA